VFYSVLLSRGEGTFLPDRPLEISIATTRNGKSVILYAEDNGLGMDLERYGDQLFKLNCVFHKHPEVKGFGLYIRRTQIKSVRGRIWARSKVDRGSTFYVEFKHLPA
jgi:sensor histidine kinase regulating citrate/malate metabolism